MEVEKVSIPLYAADYAWKIEYKVSDNVRLGVRLAKKKEGIMIMEVMENTNAARAGMLKGDLLIRMDGQKLSKVEEVLEQLQNKNFTDRSSFDLLRNGRELKIKLVFRE